MSNPFEEPSIPLDRSDKPLPGDARQQELETMERIPEFPCPHHPGEMAHSTVADGGEILYSCRKTGERVFDQDAVA